MTAGAGAAIEARSFEILSERIDLSHLGRGAAAVVARVIHASADLEYGHTMAVPEAAVAAGITALTRKAPVIADVEMVRMGISGVNACCHLNGEWDAEPVDPLLTRSAAGIRRAAVEHPEGALVVVGCAPTALEEVIRLYGAGEFLPALVVGMPVGFVGAAESKEELRRSGMPSISNVGEKGGSAVAAAAVNAMVRLAAAGSGA